MWLTATTYLHTSIHTYVSMHNFNDTGMVDDATFGAKWFGKRVACFISVCSCGTLPLL